MEGSRACFSFQTGQTPTPPFYAQLREISMEIRNFPVHPQASCELATEAREGYIVRMRTILRNG
ncbi:MAG: hypothetical protein KGL63_09155 [Betaproteobacteria bacterium]|nr:hypothetical protein [Betaproteobacteria bacterium]